MPELVGVTLVLNYERTYHETTDNAIFRNFFCIWLVPQPALEGLCIVIELAI